MIRTGQYLPGYRLPTHRQFARQHHVALATATKVYAELDSLGLITGEVGRGTFVREWENIIPPLLDQIISASGKYPPGPITDLAFCYPPTPRMPELLKQTLQQLLSRPDIDTLMQPQPVAGCLATRQALVKYLRRKDMVVDPERIMLVSGAQQGLACAVMTLFQPGDVIVVDALTYPGFTGLAQSHSLELQALPISVGGPDLNALQHLLKKRSVKGIFCMPTLHNPMGWVMDLPTRKKLVALAEQHHFWLIEDATYAFLVDSAPAPLLRLCPNRTLYVSSLSKNVSGGLRLGYLIVPDSLIARTERMLRYMVWSQPSLPAMLAAYWLNDGTVEILESEKRLVARAKQKLAQNCLEGLQIHAHPDSFFTWVKLPSSVRTEPLTIQLARLGIAVAPSSAFAVSAQMPHAIRLNLAAHTLEELAPVLHQIRQLIEEMELL